MDPREGLGRAWKRSGREGREGEREEIEGMRGCIHTGTSFFSLQAFFIALYITKKQQKKLRVICVAA